MTQKKTTKMTRICMAEEWTTVSEHFFGSSLSGFILCCHVVSLTCLFGHILCSSSLSSVLLECSLSLFFDRAGMID
jgi:hypothetical protein